MLFTRLLEDGTGRSGRNFGSFAPFGEDLRFLLGLLSCLTAGVMRIGSGTIPDVICDGGNTGEVAAGGRKNVTETSTASQNKHGRWLPSDFLLVNSYLIGVWVNCINTHKSFTNCGMRTVGCT